MTRSRTASGSTRGGGPSSALLATAERMVADIEGLVGELELLRADNQALRVELQSAVAMLERASTALGGARTRARPAVTSTDGRPRRVPRRVKGPKGRATPAEVTPDVVRAVITKLGEATASDIAAEITRAGVPVSGRAVRFLAESAGAITVPGSDGKRRYRFG